MIVMIGNIWTQNVVYKIYTKTLNISCQEVRTADTICQIQFNWKPLDKCI